MLKEEMALRKALKNTKPTMKFVGGNIVIQICFYSHGTCRIKITEGMMG